jgi:hypothetical protein
MDYDSIALSETAHKISCRPATEPAVRRRASAVYGSQNIEDSDYASAATFGD